MKHVTMTIALALLALVICAGCSTERSLVVNGTTTWTATIDDMPDIINGKIGDGTRTISGWGGQAIKLNGEPPYDIVVTMQTDTGRVSTFIETRHRFFVNPSIDWSDHRTTTSPYGVIHMTIR